MRVDPDVWKMFNYRQKQVYISKKLMCLIDKNIVWKKDSESVMKTKNLIGSTVYQFLQL